MFYKKSKSWYRYTISMLMFCVFLFSVARFFMKIVGKEEKKRAGKNHASYHGASDPFFV
jgi:hypothetical protein